MPLDLVLVLDKSGSLQYAQQQVLSFARDLIGQFSIGVGEAQVGVVEFNHDATVLIGLSSSLADLESALSGASAAGGLTSLSDGLSAGLSVLTGAGSRGGVPRALLLLTDGVQTADGDDSTAIAQASVVKGSGVCVHVCVCVCVCVCVRACMCMNLYIHRLARARTLSHT